MASFRKVLVANRGEIACRVLRTLREMGIAGAAVYSDADRRAPHVSAADEAVRLGPAPSADSYLSVDRVVTAALRVGADALHPGYGFLSENPELAESCAEVGITFIGPPTQVLRQMGSKIEAKAIAEKAGVPVIPGFALDEVGADALVARVRQLGFPILAKASAGGGGKGMRVVRAEAELEEALEASAREAAGAFGDATLLIERYIEAPRHVEIQIFGDARGNVIHCFERECSIQRRHQKVIEEAPSPALDAAQRERMTAAAVAMAKAIGYVGAGTVEFVLDQQGAFYFLEVNARLQVEHPVTEAITGLDLVRLQIEVAQGQPLSLAQDDLEPAGHAIEARLYAEDPGQDFLPATGSVALWAPSETPGLRIDSGVTQGGEVSVHYDPLLAKLIAHGSSREEARRRLVRGLEQLGVAGVQTNREFLIAILEHPAFASGELDTHFIDRHFASLEVATTPPPERARLHAIAATLEGWRRRREADSPLPASLPSGWRNNRWRAQDECFELQGQSIEVRYVASPQVPHAAEVRFEIEVDGPDPAGAGGCWKGGASLLTAGRDSLTLEIDGLTRVYRIAESGDRVFVHSSAGTSDLKRVLRFPLPRSGQLSGGCVAPMTGIIRQVCVAQGDRVEVGELLLVLEAMKMEHPMRAHAAGVVAELRVEVGQMVDPDEVLVVLESEE
jgi:acetyl-CoA carboxylase biotin carboxylase subunit